MAMSGAGKIGRIAGFAAAMVGALAHAQTANIWSAIVGPATANLNGVAAGAGPGPYVAVGDSGVILESADGAVWHAETSGTTQALFGVTETSTTFYGTAWVAVGAQGTILTSRDGLVWSPQASGVAANLRAIAYSAYAQLFMAVGDGGTVLISADSINWSVAASGTGQNLTAVAVAGAFGDGPGGFVLTGAVGTLLISSKGTTFTAVPTGTNLDFTAVGGSANVYTLGRKGLSGTLSFNFRNSTPVWMATSAGTADYTGIGTFYSASAGNYAAAVTAEGQIGALSPSGAFLSLPGSPELNAVTSGTLAIAVGNGGVIWVNAAAGTGAAFANQTVSGAPGIAFIGQTLTLHAPTANGASYQWTLNGAAIVGANQAALTLSNLQTGQAGSYAVTVTASSVLATFTTSLIVKSVAAFTPGVVDSSFQSGVNLSTLIPPVVPLPNGQVVAQGNVLLSSSGAVAAQLSAALAFPTATLIQPDGKWVEFEANSTNGSTPVSALAVRLNSDGSLDASFSVPTSALANAAGLALLPNGQFVLFSAAQGRLSWLRLNSNGSVDSSFGPGYALTYSSSASSAKVLTATDAAGRVYVAVNYGVAAPSSLLVRLDANQSPDASFTSPGSLLQSGVVEQIQPTSDGGLLYVDYGPFTGNTGIMPMTLVRLSGSGMPASGYIQQNFPTNAAFCLNSDGSALALSPSQSDLSVLSYHFVGVAPTGQIDGNIGGTIVGDPYVGSAALENAPSGIWQLLALPNGQFLVQGRFSSLNLVAASGLARVAPDTNFAATRLVNLSVRGAVAPSQVLTIGGFVAGTSQKTFLFRGSGPAMIPFGVTGVLPDPAITLYFGQTAFGANDNWSNGAGAAQVATVGANVGAFPFATGSLDAALVAAAPAGALSLQVAGNAGGSGIALAEAYDADQVPANASTARVVNFSSLDQSGPGLGQMTLGFALAGSDVRRILIRAIGPSLANFGVNGSMANPAVTLYQGGNVIATNDDWYTADNVSDVRAVMSQVGAFTLSSTSLDAVLLVTLPAGVYSAVASGAGGTGGEVLMEVYEVED
jgi:hypothetical protein